VVLAEKDGRALVEALCVRFPGGGDWPECEVSSGDGHPPTGAGCHLLVRLALLCRIILPPSASATTGGDRGVAEGLGPCPCTGKPMDPPACKPREPDWYEEGANRAGLGAGSTNRDLLVLLQGTTGVLLFSTAGSLGCVASCDGS